MKYMSDGKETEIKFVEGDVREFKDQAATEIKEFNGDLVVTKRDDGRSSSYYARVKVSSTGKWKKFSLKTDDLQEALIVAREKYKEIKVLVKHNISVDSHRFRHAARLALAEIDERIKEGSARPSDYDYQRLIPKFVEFFGDKHIESILPIDIRKFYAKRATQLRESRGKEDGSSYRLNKSTINNYAAALNRVFQIAVENNWIDSARVPHLRNEGVSTKRRPYFEPEEVWPLHEAFKRYVQLKTKDSKDGGVKERTLQIRKFLKNYAFFIISTGIRPGTEMKSLRWKHISVHTKDKQHFFRISLASGKTGERTVMAPKEFLDDLLFEHSKTFECFNGLALEEILKSERHIFRLPDGTWPKDLPGAFERALEYAGMLKDKTGQKRSLYSLRHTYATLQLLGNAPIHTVARNMGTSVYMIERHYSHLEVVQKALELSAGQKQMIEYHPTMKLLNDIL